jgi:uncharacterized protein (TIGR03083 family)
VTVERGLGSERLEGELRRQTALLAEIVRAADPALRVPSCPDWTVGDLATHVGRGHRWAATIIASGASGPVPNSQAPDRDPPDDSAGRASWLEAGAALMVAAVREAGPETRVWTWADDQTVGFWLRRMVHETVIHHADAALAVERPTDIAPDLAADGICELLEIMPYVLERPDTVGLLGVGQSIHLHATDPTLGDTGEWVLEGTTTGLRWEHGHRRSDVAVRGPAADLLLLLNRRMPTGDSRVEIIGDRAVLDGWLARTSF